MRDPYLYDDVDVLKNRADIMEPDLLRAAEADITNLAMTGIYNIGSYKRILSNYGKFAEYTWRWNLQLPMLCFRQ